MVRKNKFLQLYLRINQLDALNITLIIGAFFLCVYLLGKDRQYRKNFNNVAQNSGQMLVPKLNFTKETLAYYEQNLTKRRLFEIKTNSKKLKVTPLISLDDNMQVQTADLQLQGIISTGQVRQAIILNSKTEKSYYCQGGENIGGFIIKEVYENKIILEKDGQLTELRL